MRRPPTQTRSKQSYSHEASPVSSSYRKDTPPSTLFQMPELNPKLKLSNKFSSPYTIYNPPKSRDETKMLTTNVFINNLNIQIKPQTGLKSTGTYTAISRNDPPSQKSKRSPYRANHDPIDIEDMKENALKNYSQYTMQGSRHANEAEHSADNSKRQNPPKSATSKTSKQDLASLLSRNDAYVSPNSQHMMKPSSVTSKDRQNLTQKTFYQQFPVSGQRTPDLSSSLNKHSFRSPNRMPTPYESALAARRGHSKNQKSFDINSLLQMGSSSRPSTGNQTRSHPISHDSSPRTIQDLKQSRPTVESDIMRMLQDSNKIGMKGGIKGPSFERTVQSTKNSSTTMTNPLQHRPDSSSKAKNRKMPSYDYGVKKPELYGKPSAGPNFERTRQSVDVGSLQRPTTQSMEPTRRGKQKFIFSLRSRAGANHTGQRKTNQDSYITITNLGEKDDRHLFGVCDGHGMNGHFVSAFCKENIPALLLADPNFPNDPKTAFINAYELCNQKLVGSDFDVKFSGTTSVSVLINGDKIMTANAGDSRAVMGQIKRGLWDFTALSTDQKPNMISEAQRILKAGGRIEPFRDMDGNFVGPSRVWLMHQDIPGLAMSRSLGDMVAASVGVSCIPEIKEFSLTSDDKFMVVASDGVWEFLNNMDVVKIVVPYYEQGNIEGACDAVLAAALRTWQEEEENVVDDITLVIIFF